MYSTECPLVVLRDGHGSTFLDSDLPDAGPKSAHKKVRKIQTQPNPTHELKACSQHTTELRPELTGTSRPSYTTLSLTTRASVTTIFVVLIGCSETRTVSARLVLNRCIPMRRTEVQFSSVYVL